MPDRLFPRWCGALFALLPLSEILYLPADAQSLYAAAAACAAAGLLAAGAARLSGAVAARPGVQLLLALAALFPLVCSLSRMSSFLRATVFTRVPLWVLCLALTLCALAHALSGLNVCAMWALPAVFLAGAVAVLSGVLTAGALLALLSLRTVLLLGPHTAALLPYPNFSAAGLAAIGDFARHGEVFFAVPLILCETGRCAALMSVILRVLPKRRS